MRHAGSELRLRRTVGAREEIRKQMGWEKKEQKLVGSRLGSHQ